MWPFTGRNRPARSNRRIVSRKADESKKKTILDLPEPRDEMLEKYQYRC
jgi:hypothetical protein